MKLLRAKQKLGKYLIERKLGEGGFSVVYQAKDSIEGIRVVKGSGRPELDRFVAERVYRTRLAPPPATASLRERLFQISYEYK